MHGRHYNAKREALQEKWSPPFPFLENPRVNNKPKQTPSLQPDCLDAYADSYGDVWNAVLKSKIFQVANRSLMKGPSETV